jgi:hypothetical protein
MLLFQKIKVNGTLCTASVLKASGNAVNQTEHQLCFVGSEVPTTVAAKSMAFWVVTECNLEKGRRFREIYRLQLQGKNISQA